MKSKRLLLLSSALIFVAALALAATLWSPKRDVHAQTFTVDTEVDAVDASPGDGICATDAGSCSMRGAVQETNALPGADTVSVPIGTYTFSISGAREFAAATGDLDVGDDLSISGAGSGSTIIDAAQLDRAFDVVDAAVTATISGMSVRNGRADPDDGGAIKNDGTLTLDDLIIENNHADDGGALLNNGTATVLASLLDDNTAGDVGGAIINHGTLTVRGSSIDTNSAPHGGAGVNNLGTLTMSESLIANNGSISGNGGGLISFGTATLTNVTVSSNMARLNGGGISSESSLSLASVTITNNTADGSGGGLYTSNSGAQFRNTVIAGNHDDQCAGTGGYVSQGHNMSDSEDCLFMAGGDQQDTDPRLGSLGNNGGATLTHALLPGSPAIDAGDNVGCPPTDQRGVARPQGTRCDIGAFEVMPSTTPIPTFTPPTETPTPTRTVTRTSTPTPVWDVGDSNCDHSINSIDAALVLQHVAGLLGSLSCQLAADANQDGRLNSIDAALILQYSAGLLTHLPP